GRMTGSIMAAFPLGLALAALLSLLIIPNFGWRALFAVGVVPALLLLFVRRYMPESVRYLLSKDRVGEAEKTVAAIEHAALGRNLTDAEIKALPKLPAEAVVETQVTVAELLAPGRFVRTILPCMVSSGVHGAPKGILSMLPTIL